MSRRIFAAVLLLLAAVGVAIAQPMPDPSPDDAARIQIAALIERSAALSLPVRVERAFMLTLQAAHDALRGGETPKAVILLNTFAIEVRGAKRAKRLSTETADALIARAEVAIGELRRSQ